jgi:hypothetical protein
LGVQSQPQEQQNDDAVLMPSPMDSPKRVVKPKEFSPVKIPASKQEVEENRDESDEEYDLRSPEPKEQMSPSSSQQKNKDIDVLHFMSSQEFVRQENEAKKAKTAVGITADFQTQTDQHTTTSKTTDTDEFEFGIVDEEPDSDDVLIQDD